MNQLLLLGLIALETTFLTYLALRRTPLRRRQDRIVCDTSALIDGRIISIARSGFIASQLVIPRSVIRELQYMADKADHTKRERARYGLDVVSELQQLPDVDVVIYDDDIAANDVDEQLITLARRLSAKLCTTDYNLNKVARTEQIAVVNVNELAHALRPMHLPGEQIQVPIVAAGQNKDQGVGYLDDGSMVVVDNGRSSIGKSIQVETIRVLQTEAGRMVFARMNTPPIPARRSDSRSSSSRPARNGQHRSAARSSSSSRENDVVEMANNNQPPNH